MNDCWTVLGINPTRDVEKIKHAYRNLIKQCHPDIAYTPEQKDAFTVRCAEINAAFQRAITASESLASMTKSGEGQPKHTRKRKAPRQVHKSKRPAPANPPRFVEPRPPTKQEVLEAELTAFTIILLAVMAGLVAAYLFRAFLVTLII